MWVLAVESGPSRRALLTSEPSLLSINPVEAYVQSFTVGTAKHTSRYQPFPLRNSQTGRWCLRSLTSTCVWGNWGRAENKNILAVYHADKAAKGAFQLRWLTVRVWNILEGQLPFLICIYCPERTSLWRQLRHYHPEWVTSGLACCSFWCCPSVRLSSGIKVRENAGLGHLNTF